MIRQRGPQQVEGLPIGRLVSGEVEAASRLGQGPQQERPALTTATGHHAQTCTDGGLGGERRQRLPLTLAVEHLRGSDQLPETPDIRAATATAVTPVSVPGGDAPAVMTRLAS